MKYDNLNKMLKKMECRLEKTMKDENGEKSIMVIASTTGKDKKKSDDLKVMRMGTNDMKKTFDDLSAGVHEILLKSGVRLTLMAIANRLDNPVLNDKVE